MPSEMGHTAFESCLFQPSTASFSAQLASAVQVAEGSMFSSNLPCIQANDDDNHQRQQPQTFLRPPSFQQRQPLAASPSKLTYQGAGSNVSPLHLAALQPRNSSLGFTPSQPLHASPAKSTPDRHTSSSSSPQQPDSSMFRSAASNSYLSPTRSNSFFNRASCSGVPSTAAQSQEQPNWQANDLHTNSISNASNAQPFTRTQDQQYASYQQYLSSQTTPSALPGITPSISTAAQQPNNVSTLPSFNNMLGQAHMHMAPEHHDQQASMFSFGPAAMASRTCSTMGPPGPPDSAFASARSLCNMTSTMRRTPILSVGKDSPKKELAPAPPPPAMNTSLGLQRPLLQQPSTLQHNGSMAPRRSVGASDVPMDARSVQMSESSMFISPPGMLTAAPQPSPLPSRTKQTSMSGLGGASASPAKPALSRMSYAEPPGTPTRAFRSRLASMGGGDPAAISDHESVAQQAEGTVRHWRHPPPPTPPPPQQQQQGQRQQQQQQGDGSDGGSQPEDGGLGGSDEEYEDEGPPPPPSERTLLWLEETTRIAVGKAKIPGAVPGMAATLF